MIGPRLTQQAFVGGPLGANNPARELLKEAGIAFGNDERVVQIISIGCGIPRLLSLVPAVNDVGVGRLLKDIAADCHMVAQELSSRLINVEAYRRFNVENGMAMIELDDWSALGDIKTHTSGYIAVTTTSEALESSLRSLQSKIGSVTLGQLSMCTYAR